MLITTKLDASPSLVGGVKNAVVGDRLVKVTVRSGVTDPLSGAPLKSSSPADKEMVTVAVAVGVAVAVALAVAVAVAVAVGVAVAVAVAVTVAVAVRVEVGVADAVRVGDAVGVTVGVGVRVGEPAVGVEVGKMPVVPSPDNSNSPRP